MAEHCKIDQGKMLLQILFSVLLTFELVVISIYLINIGSDKLLTQIIRVVVTLTLVLLTYRGSRISKWILVGYMMFNSLQGLEKITGGGDYFMICLIGVYTIIPLIILFDGNVSSFLEKQKTRNVR